MLTYNTIMVKVHPSILTQNSYSSRKMGGVKVALEAGSSEAKKPMINTITATIKTSNTFISIGYELTTKPCGMLTNPNCF